MSAAKRRIKQCCENCAFAGEWQRTPTGRIKLHTTAACTYPVNLPVLPSVVHVTVSKMSIWPDDGENCRAYLDKTLGVA